MRLRRKILNIGSQENPSKAIVIPKSWLEVLRKRYGVTPEEVAIDIGMVLKINPIIKSDVIDKDLSFTDSEMAEFERELGFIENK